MDREENAMRIVIKVAYRGAVDALFSPRGAGFFVLFFHFLHLDTFLIPNGQTQKSQMDWAEITGGEGTHGEVMAGNRILSCGDGAAARSWGRLHPPVAPRFFFVNLSALECF